MNAFCPNFALKGVRLQFDDIKRIVGEDLAYFLWDKYEGNFDLAFKEALSISNYPKVGESSNPALWRIDDLILELRYQYNIVRNKKDKYKNKGEIYYDRTGYSSVYSAQLKINELGLLDVLWPAENRGKYYLKLITGNEFRDKLLKYYQRRNELISYAPIFGESGTSDPTLRDRLFNGKDQTSIGTMLTRLALHNPQHRAVIKMLQNGLSTATKSWKIILTSFSADPRIPANTSTAAGLYFNENHCIFINQNAKFRGKLQKADLSILHEIIHAATLDAILKDPVLNKQMNDMLEHIRTSLANKYGMSWLKLQDEYPSVFYGLTDISEMLAELTTDAAFARELMSIPPMKPGFKSIIDEFVDWLLGVFGITNKDNAYTELYTLLSDIILNRLELNERFNELVQLRLQYEEAPIDFSELDLLFYSLYLNEQQTFSASKAADDVDGLINLYKLMSSDIDFNEELHIYTNKHTGLVYKSVSAVKTEVGYGELEDKLPEEAVALGNFTKVIGTNIHLVLHEMLTGLFDSNSHKDLSSKVVNQINSIANRIRNKYNIISSEQVLYNDKYGVAGTADLIVQDKKTKKVSILDFKSKVKNIGDKKKSGFNYYRSSKYGKPDVDKHNFLLTMYEKLHNLAGYEIDERGIVPIEYDCTEDGTITNVYISLSDRNNTLEEKGYYTIPHRSQIDADISNYVLTDEAKDTIDQILIDRLKLIVSDILETTRNRIVNLFSRGRNTQATDIENMLSSFNTISEQEIILSYIESALTNLKNIVEGRNGYNEKLLQSRILGSEVWNLKLLENWRDVARSYKILEEIQAYLFDYSDLLPEGTYDKIMPVLDDAIRYRDILEGAYKSKGKDIWIKWITPFIKNIEGAYRIRAEKQYKLLHSGKINLAEMDAYIEQYILDNRTKILLETKNFIQQLSIMADSDINGFYRWVDTIFQSKDPIISGMAMAYDQMVQLTNETFNIKYKLLVDLTKEMELRFGTSIVSDPRKVYDYMLEETEDGITLISEIPESFKKAYRLKTAEIDADPQYKDGLLRFLAKMKWLDENAPIKNKQGLRLAKIKAVEDYLNSIDITKEEFDLVMDNEKKIGKNRKSYYELATLGIISYKRADDLRELTSEITYKFRVFDKTKFPNEKWNKLQELRLKDPNDIRVRFFDFIKELSDEGDSRVAPRYKLNGRLPGVRKTFVERIGEGLSALKTTGEALKDAFSILADDTMYGQFDLTDENNRPINYVPVFYTSRVKAEDLSFDIPNIYKLWFKSALQYANTVEILDLLEYTRFVVNERQTKTGSTSYASKVWKRMHPSSQIDVSYSVKDSSNLANQLNDWFDMIVYGKGLDSAGSIETPFFGKVDMGKVLDLFSKYASLRVMGLNYISMVNNMAQAEVALAIETFSKKYVSPKSYTKASAEFTVSLPEILGDVGARTPSCKINLLNQLFMTIDDYSNGNIRLSNKFSRLFNQGAFYFTTNIGEYEALSRFLIAMLMELRALDKNGKDIGSIYEYYTVENGELVFDKDGVVSNWDNNKRMEMSARVRSILMSMHGNYSEKDKVALLRNGYLKLALMFRKWIIPTWRKRFDGLYYDNVMQDYREGYYRTGGRFLANNVKKFFYKLSDESKAAEIAINADWHNLTEYEKANVRRFATEATVFSTLVILYSIVKGWADDDDDKFLDNIAYLLYRLRTDMGFYWNIRDMFKIVQSPFPSTSSIKSIYGLLDAVINPLDRYERGPWEGHLKLEKKVYDLMPVVRLLYRARDIENEYNILNMK